MAHNEIENKQNNKSEGEENSNSNTDLNNPDDYKKVRNNLYKRAILGFIMGIAFYQVLLFLAKMLGLY